MHFRQFYVGCLAHASYLIGDGGEAVVVDPARDIDEYVAEAKTHGLVIRWVLETHLHADFVSGHLALARRTGATVALGERAEAAFPHRALKDGDTITVGDVRIVAIATPGHTPESLSYLVYEHAGDTTPWAVLTGDTLFVGDVGRVDILSSRLPVTELAGMMYDSIHGRLLKLPDETRVYPAHGAGSLCGRGISSERWSTIGQERLTNPALRPMSREAFVADVTRDVPETPVYFLHSRDLNRTGPPVRETDELPPLLSSVQLRAALDAGATLVDTREETAYAHGHPHGALHVGLDGQYASWMGTLANPYEPLVIVAEPARTAEAVMRLARVGYENIRGLVSDDPEAWREAGLAIATLVAEPASRAIRPDRRVLDVRRVREFEDGHVADATLIPLAELTARVAELDREAEWVLLCRSGYRSAIAASVLERAGFRRLVNATGGMDAWQAEGRPVVAG